MTTTPTEPAPFDYDAPLPDLHIRARSWEPAARRYRDLTDTEKTIIQEEVSK